MEVDQKKTGGDMKVECKLRSGGDMPTPPKMPHFRFSSLAFSTYFCLIKIDLSGNTV